MVQSGKLESWNQLQTRNIKLETFEGLAESKKLKAESSGVRTSKGVG